MKIASLTTIIVVLFSYHWPIYNVELGNNLFLRIKTSDKHFVGERMMC